nr:retrotransposon protein, putative, unclassified [Tanacetum cinerariifolium]
MVQKPNRNHAMRGDHQHYARMTTPNPQRHVVPTAVLTRSRLVLRNTARPVNAVVPQTNVTRPRPAKTVVTKQHLPLRRTINHSPSPPSSNFHPKVTTAKAPKVNVVKVVKGNWNIVPPWDLNCLFAKATLDESNPWHKRLCHINFKTMNKMVKGSGPTWLLDIDTLTKSMNYQPDIAENQPNPSAGLQVKQKKDGIFISQDKYVAKILRKFGLTDGKSASTPIDTEKPLLIDLDAYSDSDYAGASLDRKSTTGGCQFLGCRLISWQCKKQTVVATSSTKAERKVIVTEDTVRQALRLNDAKSIDCLPNEEIFTELERMGYEKPSTKLTF